MMIDVTAGWARSQASATLATLVWCVMATISSSSTNLIGLLVEETLQQRSTIGCVLACVAACVRADRI
jgi:hypothetical protein